MEKRKKNLYLTGTYILLTGSSCYLVDSIIWIFPLEVSVVKELNAVHSYFFPKTYTF